MQPERRPLLHVARGIDELLRAAIEFAALALDRLEGPELERVRTALRAEVSRWDAKADGDPAAARVRDLFAAVLDVLERDETAR